MVENVVRKVSFEQDLFQRINDYFKNSNLSKKANNKMRLKIAIGLGGYFLSYLFIYFFTAGNISFLALYIFHGLFHMYLVFNIGHDANHHAISNKSSINKVLSYVFDMCGISSYLWRILHHDQHHYCQNVEGEDETLVARGFFRFTPYASKKWIHQFQHLYFPFVYGFLILDWVLVKDFDYMLIKNTKLAKDIKHPAAEYFKIFAGKIYYIGWMFVLPWYLLNISFIWIIFSFLIMQFIIGLTMAMVVQVAHPIDTAAFPAHTKAYPHYVYYVLTTTSDYAAKSNIANALLGGLHLHVVHHLFPKICHTHYKQLTQIIKETALEYGITYRENETMWKAILGHYNLLKIFGNGPVLVQSPESQ